MKKWTFSTPEGRCVPYTYGGCRGTQNLFSRCTLISSFCDRNVIRGEFDALTFVKRLKYFLILEISNKYDWQIVEVISNVMTTARLNVLRAARQSQNPAPRSALFLFNLDRWLFYDDHWSCWWWWSLSRSSSSTWTGGFLVLMMILLIRSW